MVRKIDDGISVAPQITPEDVAQIAAAGFTLIVNNRPDDESPDQPPGSAIEAAAHAAGLGYVAIPITHAGFSANQVAAMADALDAATGPVFAFCRSGTRSCNLWALARASRGEAPDPLIAKGAGAGYDLNGIRPLLETLSGQGLSAVDWTLLLGSLAAVLGLGLVARLLKLGESRITDDAMACRLAEDMLAGFVARHAVVSSDGSAALVAGNGTIAVLKRHGAKVAARRLVPPLRLREAIEGVTVDTGERMFGAVTLFGVLRGDVERLEAPLTLV